MDMVERVARAICRTTFDGIDGAALDEQVEDCWFVWEDAARAALQAMREPTQAMHQAGSMADVPWGMVETASGKEVIGPFSLELVGRNKVARAEAIAAAVYREMIGAALQPEKVG